MLRQLRNASTPQSTNVAKRYLIIDQNVLRKSRLETLLRDHPEVRCVLPDLAFFEMTKTPQWETTLRHSLAILSRCPSRVYVCLSVNEGLARELATLQPVTNHMMFPKATAFVRDLLESVRTGSDGHAMSRLRQHLPGHVQQLASDHLNDEENKNRLAGLIEVTKGALPEALQKRMRGAKVPDSQRLDILHEIGTSLLPQVLSTHGIAVPKARSFMKSKPLVLRYLYLKAWRCLTWIQNGGFESFPAKAATNEEIDNQYILSATFFHGLVSEETMVNESYQDILLLLAKKV
jgi:hypothetical protein